MLFRSIPLIVYAFIYLSWFSYLERTVQNPQTIIHMKWDDLIPFCEVFVIPYYLWFGYVSIVVLYLLFKNKQDYYRACTFLFTGMTIFLLISTLWPNGHHLRPAVMPRDNIFTTMVAAIYKADTPTNLWPSIHVYNSIGAHLAITHNEKLRKNKVIYFGSLILCISIILSTTLSKTLFPFAILFNILFSSIIITAKYLSKIINFLLLL